MTKLKVVSFRNGVMRIAKDGKDEVIYFANDEVENQEVAEPSIDIPKGGPAFTLPDDFDKLTVDELKAFAADNGIDLADKTLKEDIKSAIKAAAGV